MNKIIKAKIDITPHLPLNYEDAKEFYADGLKYEGDEVFIRKYKWVFIFHTGALYPFFRLLPGSLVHENWAHKFPSVYKPVRFIKNLVKNRITFLPEGTYLSVFDEWSSNHFHFHANLLPRLIYVQKPETVTLILPDTEYFKQNISGLLKLFHLNFKKVLFIKPGEIFLARQLLFISKTTHTAMSHPEIMTEVVARLTLPKTGPKKIYAKRVSSFRVVINEMEVENYLKEKGFEVIDFGKHSVEEQARIAANAEIMIGIHGAALANIVYMPKGSKVVEFRRTGIHVNHCYWHLATAVGLEYTTVFGLPDDESKEVEAMGCSLYIPLEEIKKVV